MLHAARSEPPRLQKCGPGARGMKVSVPSNDALSSPELHSEDFSA